MDDGNGLETLNEAYTHFTRDIKFNYYSNIRDGGLSEGAILHRKFSFFDNINMVKYVNVRSGEKPIK